MTSDPPQCRGVPLVGWDWAKVRQERSLRGTTWTGAHVQGTYDGQRFTLTAPPSAPRPEPVEDTKRFEPVCEKPDVVDASKTGADWEEAVGGEGAAGRGEIPGLAAVWVSDPSGPDWDGPFVANVVVRPGFVGRANAFIREFWLGHLCRVERDQPTAGQLEDVFAQLRRLLGKQLLLGHVDYRRGVVFAKVILVDDAVRAKVDRAVDSRLVELRSALRPIS